MGNIHMDNRTYKEFQINIYGLICRTLLRWRIILIAGLICGLFGGFSNYQNQMETIEKYNSAIKSESDPVAEVTADSVNGDAVFDILTKKLHDETQYISESAVAETEGDAYNGSAVIYFENNNEEASGFDYEVWAKTLHSAAKQLILNSIDYSPLCNELNLKNEKYIKELIKMDSEGSNLIVNVYYKNYDGAEAITNYIINHIDGVSSQMNSVYGDFTCKALYTGTSRTVFDYNAVFKETSSSWIVEHIDSLNSLLNSRTIMNNVRPNLNTSSSSADKPQQVLTVSKSQIIKNFVLYTIFGTVAAFLVIAAKLMLKGCITATDDIENRYSIPTLATVPLQKWKNRPLKGIDNTIANIIQKNGKNYSADYVLIVDEEINSRFNEQTKIAVIGDVDKADLNEIRDSLAKADTNREFIVLDDVAGNVEDRKKLSECSGVIIVAKTEVSHYSEMDRIVGVLRERNKMVLGSINI